MSTSDPSEHGSAPATSEPDDGVTPSWEVVITADREYFDRIAPRGVEFPSNPVRRVVALTEREMLIGRRSRRRGTNPEVDCGGPPADPAISHRHARLVRDDAGNYAVCDLGSTNGTTINDDPRPIPMNLPISLKSGDRINVGAWTSIVIGVAQR